MMVELSLTRHPVAFWFAGGFPVIASMKYSNTQYYA